MSTTSRKAQKRKLKKQRKLEQLEKKTKEENIKFDVISLLRDEPLDTKPKFADFLKKYLKSIRALVQNKIDFFPDFHYTMTKIFVKFLDGHEIIYDLVGDGKIIPIYSFYDDLEEIQLKSSDEDVVKVFFDRLIEFKFVY